MYSLIFMSYVYADFFISVFLNAALSWHSLEGCILEYFYPIL